MWAGILLIIGDESAIMVAATCLVFVAIGLGVAYLVRLLDRVKPGLGSRLSLIPVGGMCFLISGSMWTWISGDVLPGMENVSGDIRIGFLAIPIMVATAIMVGWVLNNLEGIKGGNKGNDRD